MAVYQQLPGFGNAQTISLAMTTGSGIKLSDTFDMSRCAQIALQVTTWASGNLTVKLQRSFDGVNFTDIATGAVLTVGGALVYDITDGPFGLIRVSALSTDTTATAAYTLVGWELQRSV